MAEGNTSNGINKSRSVLGDVTNRLGKRGFSEREKNVVKSYSFNDKYKVKHIRVSPGPCTEINSLKGNLISRISNILEDNKNLKVSDVESGDAVSNFSVDVGTDLTHGCGDGEGLKGKNVAMCNEEFLGGSKDFKILELSERDANEAFPQSVNAMDAINRDLANTAGDVLYFEDEAMRTTDKMGSENYMDPDFRDLEGGRVVNSIDTRADGCGPGKFDLSNDNVILGIPNAATENKCFNLTDIIMSNVDGHPRKNSGDVIMDNTKICNKNNKLHSLDLGRGSLQCVNIEAHDKLTDSIPVDTSSTVNETDSDCSHDGIKCDADEAKVSVKGNQKNINDHQNEVDDYNADNLVMSQSGSVDCAIIPESQESRIFGIEKSTEPKKGDEFACFNGGVDSIKSCSCSFCTKAAYIWLDLNYQDIKARVSAMKKSQKEASILCERIYWSKATDKNGAESSTRISKLESDLTQRWRFLFQHMADIWEEEGSRLEASLLPLTDLREKCKTDLELINAVSSEKQ